jgi:hypothetical protein
MHGREALNKVITDSVQQNHTYTRANSGRLGGGTVSNNYDKQEIWTKLEGQNTQGPGTLAICGVSTTEKPLNTWESASTTER